MSELFGALPVGARPVASYEAHALPMDVAKMSAEWARVTAGLREKFLDPAMVKAPMPVSTILEVLPYMDKWIIFGCRRGASHQCVMTKDYNLHDAWFYLKPEHVGSTEGTAGEVKPGAGRAFFATREKAREALFIYYENTERLRELRRS